MAAKKSAGKAKKTPPPQKATGPVLPRFIYVGPERPGSDGLLPSKGAGISAYGFENSFDRNNATAVKDERIASKLRANPEFEEV